MNSRYAKLIVKDSSGNLVQLLPETMVANEVSDESNLPVSSAAVAEALSEYQGATVSANGTAGLVPAATIAEKDNYLKGDGTWASLTLPADYVGATSEASGTHGLVPAATSAERNSYLKGDGTWGEIGSLPASQIGSGTFDAARIPDLDASKIATGTIDIARLPAGALERLVTVADQTARFALNSSDVQLGDTVRQSDTGLMYYVVDTSKLSSADGYAEYTAGAATSVPWSGITGKPASFTPEAHNQASNTINAMTGYSKPSSTSAIGTSDTLNSAIGKLEKSLDGKAPTSHASSATTYGVSSASNYGHAKASGTTPKAPASTASVGSETSSFARGDHVHPLQKAVTGVSVSCSPNVARHVDDVNATFELPTLFGYAVVSSVSAGLQSQQLQLDVKETYAPITNLQEDFLTSGIIYWSDSFNIIENSDLDYYINDPSQFSDITIDSFEDLYLDTSGYFNIGFDTSTATGNDLRPYPDNPIINENLTGVRMVENLYITVPPQVGETITFKNVPVVIETDYYQYSNDSTAIDEDLEFFEKYVGSFDFFLERLSTTNFRIGFRWNVPGGATVELTAANSDSTTDTSSFIIPEYHGASTNVDGGSGLVPAAKSSERNYYLKGDGTWASLTLPTDYVGATSEAAGTHGLVPAATSAERNSYLKGDGTWASLTLPADYVGATSGASGTHGLVPAATSAERNNYLKGDGTWASLTLPATYVGATSNSSGTVGLVPAATSAQKDNYLKGDGTWGEVSSAKEVAQLSAEPTSLNTADLDNGSIIFWNTSSAQNAPQPVYTTGNQTVQGVKTFTAGIFSGKQTMSGNAIDCAAASCFTKTVTGNTTFSFTNVPEDAVCCITVILINGGNYTITWPSSVKWTGNIPPELTQNGTDVLTFLTCTGGNVWYGTTTCIGVTA